MKIGVLDSGIGGHCLLEPLREALPEIDFIYHADQPNRPYGSKSADEVRACVLAAAKSLEVDALILACHTASAYALDSLRNHLSIPIFGMIEPTLREANAFARIGLIATRATIASGAYSPMIFQKSPPLLPELAEAGLCDGPLAHAMVQESLADHPPLDALILGCTHYPFLRTAIQKVVGPEITLIDGIAACVEEVERHCRAESLQPQLA